jgi:type IV pilus assembly protein PilM
MMGRNRADTRTSPRNGNGRVIGLDLGATSVRATSLTLSTRGGRPAVTTHAAISEPLPAGAIQIGLVTEQAVVTEALKRLWTNQGLTGRRVILGVANPQVVVRPLEIPNLNAQQRAKALPFQAREIIALPLDEVILDYVQLGVPDPETGMVSGLLIATPRRPVLAAVEAVERAGLKVARVDLSSFGALRAIADEHLAVQAVIDFGAQLTSIVIHHHGVPQLVRTLARGGQELTDILAERLHLTSDAAELVKCETGVADHGQSDRGPAGHGFAESRHSEQRERRPADHRAADQRADAAEILQAGLRPLLAEIRSSINYFRASNDNAPLEGISLTGGGSALPGLAAALARQHGVPTDVVGPMQRIAERQPDSEPVGADSDQAASAVSIGLAMGAAA